MAEWKRVRLGEIAKINPLFTLKKGVVAKKVAMDKITPHCRDITSYVEESYSGGVKFINGCTLMARITPCLENGKIAQVRFLGNNEVAFGSTEFIVFQDIDGVSDKDFIYYLINTDLIRQKAIDSMVGSSGRQRAQSDEIAKISISLPPLPTQRKIAAVLGAIDDKIETNRKICANLEAQAQALFKSWFVDFEPFGGKMPQGWKMGKLGDIVYEIETGSRPKGGAEPEGIPSIGAEKIEGLGVYNYDGEKYISKAFYRDLKRGKLRDGDVLVYKDGAYTGKVSMALNGFPHAIAAVNEHVFILRTKDSQCQSFLYCLLRQPEMYKAIHDIASAKSAQPGLNQGELLSVVTNIPEGKTIIEFESLVSGLLQDMATLAKQSRALAAMRDALLPKLMSGEIDVSKVEVA